MNLAFCDAHSHLQDDRFGGRAQELLATARAVGVQRWVVNGSCEADWAAVAELSRQEPGVIPSFGYHPWYLRKRPANWQVELNGWLDQYPQAAIGEIGLDRWILEQTPEIRSVDVPARALRSPAALPEQVEIFKTQWLLAHERRIPVTIHCLQAWGPLLDCLRAWPRLDRGFLLHSYGGARELIPELSRLGAYFGFPGYFLHARKERQGTVFRDVPKDRLLAETDAPDQPLPDEWNRFPLVSPGTQRPLNHPANLPAIYEGLASVLGKPVRGLRSQLAENFERLFGEKKKI